MVMSFAMSLVLSLYLWMAVGLSETMFGTYQNGVVFFATLRAGPPLVTPVKSKLDYN